MQFIDRIRMNTLSNKDMALICGHYIDLFMVMDRPLRKGNSECECEKQKKSIT